MAGYSVVTDKIASMAVREAGPRFATSFRPLSSGWSGSKSQICSAS